MWRTQKGSTDPVKVKKIMLLKLNELQVHCRYRQFIAQAPGETPLAVDNTRLNTSIRRSIQKKLEKPNRESAHETSWLLIFSNSAYPEIDCCVRGHRRDSEPVSIAREYLKSHDPILFDQIWYSNPVTIPVRIWPHIFDPIC